MKGQGERFLPDERRESQQRSKEDTAVSSYFHVRCMIHSGKSSTRSVFLGFFKFNFYFILEYSWFTISY